MKTFVWPVIDEQEHIPQTNLKKIRRNFIQKLKNYFPNFLRYFIYLELVLAELSCISVTTQVQRLMHRQQRQSRFRYDKEIHFRNKSSAGLNWGKNKPESSKKLKQRTALTKGGNRSKIIS